MEVFYLMLKSINQDIILVASYITTVFIISFELLSLTEKLTRVTFYMQLRTFFKMQLELFLNPNR